MSFADFVMVALAAPCIVLVLSGYGLLGAVLVTALRRKIAWEGRGAARRAAAKG